ncbi:MAG: hypothetical protein E7331_05855 [Clostridiales bacterium]|nr:hypothetical protein [Clostridiales bacterium]
MKKILALILAIMMLAGLTPAFAQGLILTSGNSEPAAAPSLQTETITLDCGLTFSVPVGWSDGPLPAEFQNESELLTRYDAEGRFMEVLFSDYSKGETYESLAEAISEDDTFTNVEVKTSGKGQKIIYTESTTGDYISMLVLDGEGTAYLLNFGTFYDMAIVDDPTMQALTGANMETLLLETASDISLPDTSDIQYETVTMEGDISFPYPSHWAFIPSTDEMMAQRIFAAFEDKETHRAMEARLDFLDDGTTFDEQLAVMQADTDTYQNVIGVPLENGTDIMVFILRDGVGAGYAVLDCDGDLCVFTFHRTDGVPYWDDEVLMMIISHCASNTMTLYEKPSVDSSSDSLELEYITLENRLVVPWPKGWSTSYKQEDELFRAEDHANSRLFYVSKLSSYGLTTADQLMDALSQSDQFEDMEVVHTNNYGIDILVVIQNEERISLTFPDGNGSAYVLVFATSGSPIMEDELMMKFIDEAVDTLNLI